MIVNNTYVEDILLSTESADGATNVIWDAEEILSLGGFHVKYRVVSGCPETYPINVMESDCEKILGVIWTQRLFFSSL